MPAQVAEGSAVPTAVVPASAPANDEAVIKARQQVKQGNLYQLDGDVEIEYQGYTLRAEHVTYDSESGASQASGNVVLDGGPHDAHLEAARSNYNIRTETGTFYDVVGSFGALVKGRSVVLTSDNPFMVTGREVQKAGRNRYIVLHGTITSCTLPSPDWTFNAEKIDVEAGEDAKVYHATFRLRKIPLFYFPYMQHPADTLGRQTGFLIPSFGQSSSKGFIFGDSLYWAINRSMDATIGAEYWSKRGWSQHGEFRARPSESSSLNVHYFGVLDRGLPSSGQDQSGQEVRMDGVMAWGHWRGVADIDYLSSFLFREAFAETYTQAVNSEVTSVAFLSRNRNGFSWNLMGERYQNFSITQSSNSVKIMHEPSFEVSSVDRRLGRTPFTGSFDVSLSGISRHQSGFATDRVVGRFDVSPRVALPMEWKGFSVRPELALRNTYYTQEQSATTTITDSVPLNTALNRRSLEASVELRPPSLERVFKTELRGRAIKHVIEPRVEYHFVTGINHFLNVIRFDERDILSNTNHVEYGFTQRLYARRHQAQRDPRCDAAANGSATVRPGASLPGTSATPLRCDAPGATTREIVTWELVQRYYADTTFGGAVLSGQRNVVAASEELTGIAFLTGARRFSPIVSRLRISTTVNTDVQWQLDYDTQKGRINSSTALLDYRFGPIFVGASHTFLRMPEDAATLAATAPSVFNQFRGLLGYGHPNKRGLSAGISIGYDQHFDYVQYGAVQGSYNWDCCGVNVEYRRFALPGVRNENSFRFAFTLANFGTFGNLRRQERLY